VNSLGQRLVPAGTPGVLFATHQTRVQDFEAFAKITRLWPGGTMFVNYDGTSEGWQTVRLSWSDPGFPQTPEHPVVGVSQFDATAFCEWLTNYERKSGRIGAGDFYRLPTDAEWSVAAGLAADAHDPAGVVVWRGAFPPPPNAGNFAGEELREDERFARYPVIAGRRDAHRFTAPVGSYPPNARGLHDLGANVTEWLHSDDPNRAQMRGANWWDSAASSLDAGKRRTHPRSMRAFTSGFRIVLVRPSAP
jgi:formylglycine-generating enzyme required for sulfatase activity